MLIRAASHAKAREAEKATSRVSAMWKCQVSVPPCLGLLAGSPISPGERIITVVSLWRALASWACSCAVSTSPGFINSPEPATSMLLGTVTK